MSETNKKNILIIDDEESIRKSFSMLLELEGFATDTAENGQVGLEKLAIADFDLVLLDLKMPKMNGVETLSHIYQSFPHIPVFIVTAFSQEFMQGLQDLNDKGVDFELLHKPIDGDDLIQAINSIFSGSQVS